MNNNNKKVRTKHWWTLIVTEKKMSTKIKTKKRKVKEKLYHSGKDNELIYKPLKRKVTAKGEKKYI